MSTKMVTEIQPGLKRLTAQKGAALSLALIIFALSVLMLVPLLSFIGSGYKTTDRVYDRKANELYAADSGVRDAIWSMKYTPYVIPQESGDTQYSSSLTLNSKTIDYTISYISQFYDSDGGLLKTYKIASIASDDDGRNTEIISYAVQPFGENNVIFDNAIASGAGMDFKKDAIVCDGPIAYKTYLTGEDNLTYDPDGDGVADAIPSADASLELPSDEENLIFANAYKSIAQAGTSITGSYTFTGSTLGPLYVDGELDIDSEYITLNGPVYATGDISFTKEVTLEGQGVFVAEGDINFEKGSTFSSSDPDTLVVYMSLYGDIYMKKEQGVYNGIFYAPKGTISLKKGQQITGSLIAGEGFSTDKNLSVTYVTYNEETILPGYVALTPQLQTWDITAAAGIQISPSTLSSCKVNTAYPSQILTASGGVSPYTWVTSGSLPDGLTLSSSGSSTATISGTPVTLGTFEFTVIATDNNAASCSREYSIVITALEITTASTLTEGTVGSSYSETLSVSGGTSPYTWSVDSGSLPAGLSFNETTGVISGTPTTSGSAVFVILVTDSDSNTVKKSFSIYINGVAALTITTTSLSEGTVGSSYSKTLAASGGSGTGYTWSLPYGSLPAGLSLSSGGVISGTPTTAGTSTFTVQVTDSASNTATKSMTLTINNFVPTLSSILPTSAARGSTLNVILTGTNFISGVSTVNVGTTYITLNSTTVDSSTKITINITISSSGSAKGSYNFTVTNSGTGGGTSGTQAFTVSN